MHATDIVAYTYQAELLCPACTMAVVNNYDMAYPPVASGWSTEQLLDFIAANPRVGIDRSDEGSFDSSEFPKVVFADQAYHCEDCRDYEYVACDHCGEPIVND